MVPYLQRGELRLVAESSPEELEACRRLLPGLLDLFQIVWLLREGNKRGCHIGIARLCADSSYDIPAPINPEQVRDELRKETIESVKKLELLVKRLELLDSPTTKAPA